MFAFIAFGVRHSGFVDFPKQHLGKTFVYLIQRIVEGHCTLPARSAGKHLRRFVGFVKDGRLAVCCPGKCPNYVCVRETIDLFVHIVIIDIFGDIGEQLFAYLI